jgi:AraC-like DNA-binding protein
MRMKSAFKVGYTAYGGLYFSENVKTGWHQHHAITIILSFEGEFEISLNKAASQSCFGVAIYKDIAHQYSGSGAAEVFIHLDPYSLFGQSVVKALNLAENLMVSLDISLFEVPLAEIKKWSLNQDRSYESIRAILNMVCTVITAGVFSAATLDDRVMKSLHIIQSLAMEDCSLNKVAALVFLSPDRFAHLFKQETGTTFRKYLLHCKLIKSLKAIHDNDNLSTAAYEGGFADPAHFTRTYTNAFGINPSKTVK